MRTPFQTILILSLTLASTRIAAAQAVDWHPSQFAWTQTASGEFVAPVLPVPRLPEFEPKSSVELETIAPVLAVEGATLRVTAPANSPALLLVGPRRPLGSVRGLEALPSGARVELAPRKLVPFQIGAEGRAELELPAEASWPSQRLQVLVFNGNRTEVAVNFPSYRLGDLASTGTAASAAGPGFTASAGAPPGGNAYGGLGAACTSYCASCEDLPDAEFVDSNCDGIDGDAARAFFVDLVDGNPSGAGTMADPLLDLQFAIDLAAATPGVDHVYVSDDVVFGTLYLADGVSVWGGFDPSTGWSRSGQQTAVVNLYTVASAEGYVGVFGANIHTPTVFADFEVEAWAGGFLVNVGGQHAIGMHLHQVTGLTLERVTLTGAYASIGIGGASVGTGSSTHTGGNGGSGGTSSSLPGSGKAGGGSTCGLGGLGGLGGAPYFNGFTGFTGVVGLPGAFASATSFGSPSLSGALLVVNGTGNNGSNGCQGGAGGGGGGGGYAWPVGNGGKGGKGGSGGKAGLGGRGGKPGGCSVGLMLVDAEVEVLDSTLIAHHGGLGGTPGSSTNGTSGSGGSAGQVISGRPDGGDGGPGGAGGLGGFASPGASGHCYAVLASSGSDADLQGTTLQASDPGQAFPWFPNGIAGEAVLYKQL